MSSLVNYILKFTTFGSVSTLSEAVFVRISDSAVFLLDLRIPMLTGS